MARVIQIDQNTIVKILIRRGTDSERQLTTLTEGELGYTIDTRRLYIGDGITLGGLPVGNRFLGIASDRAVYNSIAAAGDTIYQNAGGNESETLYGYLGDNQWTNIHPKPYRGSVANTIACLEKSTEGYWRVTSEFINGDTTPSGFSLAYEDVPGAIPYGISGKFNRVDFDSRYISLCADNTSPYLNSSFWFGNVEQRKVGNWRNAVVNVDNSIFINGRQSSNTHQVQLYATDPADSGSSILRSTVNNFRVRGSDQLRLEIDKGESYRVEATGNLLTTTFSSREDGTFTLPNFLFKGISKFENPVFFDNTADVTIYGNLSVLGDTTYLETNVTTTSALSVINNNRNVDAFVVVQNNFGGLPINNNQYIGRFEEGEFPYSVLAIRENQFVGINVDAETNYSTVGANFVVSGGMIFKTHPLLGGNILIDHNNIKMVGVGSVEIGAKSPGNMYLSAGALGYISVFGGLRATDDIVAFSTSDVKLKKNVSVINSPLEKISKISGVKFDWSSEAPFIGHDIGVLAHEIEEIIPEAVITRNNGTKAVRYEKIIPLLIESIKELKLKVENNNVKSS
jgi:hypothetical protein